VKIMKILMELFSVVFNAHYHCQNLISIHLLNIAVVQMVLNTVALILKSIIIKTLILIKNIYKKLINLFFSKKSSTRKISTITFIFCIVAIIICSAVCITRMLKKRGSFKSINLYWNFILNIYGNSKKFEHFSLTYT